MFGKRIDKPGGCRKAVRDDMMIRAAMLTLTDSMAVDVLDLSRNGVRVRGSDLPQPGKEVILLVGRLEAFGSVVWRDGNECGIHFDIALSDQALAIVERERDPSLTRTNAEAVLAAVDWNGGLAR